MKNSRKSQIAVIIGLAITIILSYILFMGVKWGLPVMKFYILTYILFIIGVELGSKNFCPSDCVAVCGKAFHFSLCHLIFKVVFQSVYNSFHFIQKCFILHDFLYCCIDFFVCHNSLSPFLLVLVRGSSGGWLFKYLAFYSVRPNLPYPFPL